MLQMPKYSFHHSFFLKGDVIHVKRQIDENWCEGKLNNKVGIFPVTFVEVSLSLCKTLLYHRAELNPLTFKIRIVVVSSKYVTQEPFIFYGGGAGVIREAPFKNFMTPLRLPIFFT